MLNFSRRDRSMDARAAGKAELRPALYEPPGSLAKPVAGTATRHPPPPPAGPARDTTHLPARDEASVPAPPIDASGQAASAASASGAAARGTETPGSKLFVGVNIKLKGVEISDCDVLVIEGRVEASVHSKAMEIARPGTLTGTALIDVAEIHGEFSGELTARMRLVVHGTGRVRGTVRYGKLVVAEGGEVNGDVRQIDAAARVPELVPAAKAEVRAAQASMLPRNDRGQASERLAPTGS
jgi:cytoskeletal protein CcmA (bactofilin family)